VIFFLGEIYKNETLKKNSNLSAASSHWNYEFIKKLEKISKVRVVKIQYLKDKPWPIGRLFSNNINSFNTKDSILISYLNLPYLRKFIIYHKIIKEIKKKIIKKKDNNIIITYNFLPIDIKIAIFLKKLLSFKWISICADFNCNEKILVHKKIVKSDRAIFLSEYAYRNYKHNNKLLYNGEIKKIIRTKTKKIKNFLYSGSLGNWTGIKSFLEEFIKIENKYIKLYITTNNKKDLIKNYLDLDKRIIYLGYLNDHKYKILVNKIDCFVNLRDENNKNNLNNFPSKILKYLYFNKPIISSYMENLSFDLSKVLIMKKRYQKYSYLIQTATQMKLNDINNIKNKIYYFFLNKKKKDKLFFQNIINVINK
jgi:hypothetical protein